MSFPESVYTIDLIFLLFLLFFGLNGLRRGLSGELAHVLTLVALLCGFFFFYPTLTQEAAFRWSDLSLVWIQVVVAAVMGFVALLLFFIGRALFKLLLKTQVSEVTDKLAGSLMGLLRGLVIGLTLLGALSFIPSERVYTLLTEKSMVGNWVCTVLTPWAHPKLMELPMFDQEEN